MQGEFLDGRIGMKSGGGGAIEEGNEDARLFGENANGFERTEANEVEEFVDGGVWGEVAHINGSAGLVACGCCSCGDDHGGIVALGGGDIQGRRTLLLRERVR